MQGLKIDPEGLEKFAQVLESWADTLEIRAGYLRQHAERVRELLADRDPEDSTPVEDLHTDGRHYLRPVLTELAQEIPELIEEIGEAEAGAVVEEGEE